MPIGVSNHRDHDAEVLGSKQRYGYRISESAKGKRDGFRPNSAIPPDHRFENQRNDYEEGLQGESEGSEQSSRDWMTNLFASSSAGDQEHVGSGRYQREVFALPEV